MRQLSVLLVFVAVIFCCLFHHGYVSAESIVRVSDTEKTCTAECNGTVYDIKELIKKNSVIEGTHDSKTYDFEFSCTGKPCGNDNISSAVCQREKVDSNPRSWSCGSVDGAIWSVQGFNPLVLTVAYSNGDENDKKNKRRSLVKITVNVNGSDSFTFEESNDKSGTYSFNVQVNSVNQIEASRSKKNSAGIIGWVVISLSFVAFVTYFIAGGVFMGVVKGARGLEIIPNFEFWKSFPFLLKDGFMFTISPCIELKRRRYDQL